MSEIAYHRRGSGPPLLLLHATLTSSRELGPLAASLADRFDVISVDRRGSGESAGPGPAAPIDVAVHVEDLVAIAAAEGLGPALVVGHSYGGCIALELAARKRSLVAGVFAYEPPYGPVAPPSVRAEFAAVARRTLEAAGRGDLEAAALEFMAGVSGRAAVEALSPPARARIARAGRGAVADATLLGMDPAGLPRIARPVVVATGTASEPLYADIATDLVGLIPGASHQRLPGLGHMAPIIDPDEIAEAVSAFVDALEAHQL